MPFKESVIQSIIQGPIHFGSFNIRQEHGGGIAMECRMWGKTGQKDNSGSSSSSELEVSA